MSDDKVIGSYCAIASSIVCVTCLSSLYPLAYSSDSGGSDSEGGSVSRRKKKISRDKDKSRKSKKEKDEEKRKGVNITCIML